MCGGGSSHQCLNLLYYLYWNRELLSGNNCIDSLDDLFNIVSLKPAILRTYVYTFSLSPFTPVLVLRLPILNMFIVGFMMFMNGL